MQVAIGLIRRPDTKYSITHNYARKRTDSYNYLLLEKILTLHKVIILIKLVPTKNRNHYCFKISLERDSFVDKLYTQFF